MAVGYIVFGVGNYRVSCLSGDEKPAADDGTTLCENDTGKYFCRIGGAWVEVLNSSYATAAQGATANSALQPAGNGGSLTGLTKTQVGLANADNTTDAAKPVSTATQTALDAKQATLVSATNIKTVNGTTLLGSGDLVVAASMPEVLQSTRQPAADVSVAANFSVFADEEFVIPDGFEVLLETNASLMIL